MGGYSSSLPQQCMFFPNDKKNDKNIFNVLQNIFVYYGKWILYLNTFSIIVSRAKKFSLLHSVDIHQSGFKVTLKNLATSTKIEVFGLIT